YAPIKVRNTLVPVCNIGSSLGIPIAILGYFLGFEPLITVGLLLYAAIAVFHLVTLPVEFNASKRAVRVIDDTRLLYDDEISGAKKVLTAAAMTYVASLVVAIANLLRLVLRFNNRRN
ncbi:MAG: zinc metallopeptidase, partial [Clostridia bacterium]|nr:zinc metallopeptidase [Clostridia bacterium]